MGTNHKMDNFYYTEIRNFLPMKNITNKVNHHMTEGETIFAK